MKKVRYADLRNVTNHKFAVVISSWNDFEIAEVGADEQHANAIYVHLGRMDAQELDEYCEDVLEYVEKNNEGEPVDDEIFDCWEWVGENESRTLVFPESWV